MTRRLAALAVAALLSAAACDSGDDTSGATTTSSPDRPSSSTTTTVVPAVTATDQQVLDGVAAGSAEGATLLPEDRWLAGVRTGCADLPAVPDDQVDDFFELLRIQVENSGGTREQSRAAVLALVGGFTAACPDLASRLAPLVPPS